jgi:RNA polymerase sigma-70 factor (ECF subfamily)
MGANRAHLSVVDTASSDDLPGFGGEEGPAVQGAGTPGADGVDVGFVAIYEVHYPRLVRALELGGTDRTTAEDVAQEAFARTFERWQRVRRGTNPAGYVYRVGFRLARRHRRRELPLSREPVSPDIATEVTMALEIERALRAMPVARRRCAVLCLAAGLSTKEAARALGIAQSTVRKQIERARADLRGVLGDQA